MTRLALTLLLAAPLTVAGCAPVQVSGGAALAPDGGRTGGAFALGTRYTPGGSGGFGFQASYEVATFPAPSAPDDAVFEGGHATVLVGLAGSGRSGLYALAGGRTDFGEAYGVEGGLGGEVALAGPTQIGGAPTSVFAEGGYGSFTPSTGAEAIGYPFVRAGLQIDLFGLLVGD